MKILKPLFCEDDCASDALDYFKKQIESIGVCFSKLKDPMNYKTNSEPDEVVYCDGEYVLYQDAYNQLWELYSVEDIKKTNSHLNRFV